MKEDEGEGDGDGDGAGNTPQKTQRPKVKSFTFFLATLSNMYLWVSVQTLMSISGEKRCL